MRIVTTQEQLLFDLIQEQKRTNELLEKLIPATPVQTIPAAPEKTPTTPAPVPTPPKRGR